MTQHTPEFWDGQGACSHFKKTESRDGDLESTINNHLWRNPSSCKLQKALLLCHGLVLLVLSTLSRNDAEKQCLLP